VVDYDTNRSTKRDELFGRGRVNSDAVVEVGLGGAHFHRDTKSLQHLVAPDALHVETDHLQQNAVRISVVSSGQHDR